MSETFLYLSKFLPKFVYPVGLSTLLLVLSLFFGQKPKRRTLCIVVALLYLWISGLPWVANGLVRSLERQHLPMGEVESGDVIVVLGDGTRPAEPPRQTLEVSESGDRMLYAAWLYEHQKAPQILLVGGSIDWYGVKAPESVRMAAILERVGVPEEAIWLESESLNTYENAVYTRKFLSEKGMNRILLVTSAYHMPRSVYFFEKEGFEVIPAPTDFIVTERNWQTIWEPNWSVQLLRIFPGVGNIQLTTLAIKEYIGLAVYWLLDMI